MLLILTTFYSLIFVPKSIIGISKIKKISAFAILAFFFTNAYAIVFFDQNVTNNVILGRNDSNGSFTVERSNGIELGIRAKLRFDSVNQPQNIFNSNGDGTYSFAAEIAPGGFSFASNSPTTPIWNFEWSINVNFNNSSGFKLDDLTYVLGIDFDPSVSTNFQKFDLINLNSADHAIGTNAINAGAGKAKLFHEISLFYIMVIIS